MAAAPYRLNARHTVLISNNDKARLFGASVAGISLKNGGHHKRQLREAGW